MRFNKSKSKGNIVTDGLVLYLDAGIKGSYPGNGTTWTDLSSSNNGTLTNGPTFDSANGGSIVFDGSNDYVSLGSNAISTAIDANTDFTIEVAFRFDTVTSGRTIIQQEDDANGTGRTVIGIDGNGTNIFSYLGGSYLYSTTLPAINTIYYFFLAYSSGTLSLWRNSTQQSSSAKSLNGSTGGFRLGSGKTTVFLLDGNIYFCRMYNRALSAAEVAQNFEATRNRFGI
jgi:hypothetical protein